MLSRVNNPVFLLVLFSLMATGLILFHVHNSLFNFDRFDDNEFDTGRTVQAAHRQRPPIRLPCITNEVLEFADILNGKGFILEPTILEKYHNVQTNITLRADCSISAHAKFVTFGAIAGTHTVTSPCDMKTLVDAGFACDQLTSGNWSTLWPPGNYLISRKSQLIHLVLLRREGNDLVVEPVDQHRRPFGIIDPTAIPYSFGLAPTKLIGNFTIHPVEIGRRTIFVAGKWALKNAIKRNQMKHQLNNATEEIELT